MTVLIKLNTFNCEQTEVSLVNEGKKKWKLVDKRTGFTFIQQVHSADEETGDVVFKMKGKYWKYLLNLYQRGFLKFYTKDFDEIPADNLITYEKADSCNKQSEEEINEINQPQVVVTTTRRVTGNPLTQMKNFKKENNMNENKEVKSIKINDVEFEATFDTPVGLMSEPEQLVSEGNTCTAEDDQSTVTDQLQQAIDTTVKAVEEVEKHLEKQKPQKGRKYVNLAVAATAGAAVIGGVFLYNKYFGGKDA